MKFVNKSPSKAYCTATGTTVGPYRATTERPALSDFFKALRHDAKGFNILLSDQDLKDVQWLLESDIGARYVLGLQPPESEGHLERASRLLKERRSAIQATNSAAMAEAREKEARIQAESNYLDDLGRPVNDKMTASALTVGVEPELHPEMSTDVKSVLANNLAMMDKFRHAPNTTVAGDAKVSTDPRYYQNLKRTTPPGVPDLPGAAETVKSAAEANKFTRGQPV